jgi:hypothetical protein
MAYTALQLITRAYYLSQVVSRDLQTPSGSQVSDGLYLLNASLDFKSSDLRLIPYFDKYSFNAVQGQETYNIPNLLFVDTMTFNIGPVRYSLNEFTREQYFGIPRVDNIQSLPYCYRVERALGGCDISLYFLPASNYLINIVGKFGLTEVTLNTDLSLIYDFFYIEYLRYALAEMICCEWGATLPDGCRKMLQEYEKKVMDVSPPDLSIRSQSFFSGQCGFDWQMANLYKGYVP